jgi:hypothetical protein
MVYPLVRIRKVQPDGVVRWSWFAYRIPDRAGSVRLFVPPYTPRRHQNGTWAPDGPSVMAIDAGRPFVVHRWERDGQTGFYVDTARSIEIGADVVTYVDLFLDLSFHDGAWRILDEDELTLASEDDVLAARASRAAIEQLIALRDPLFDPDADLWRVPPDVAELQPQDAPALK